MTKRNVIVPDTKSAMINNMEINVAASVSNSSSLFSTTTSSAATTAAAAAKSMQQQHLQNLDIKTDSRITSWVDSMKASSPTHIKSNPSSYHHDPDDQSCWIQQHPSALEMFEQIIKASKGKQIVMFLDYDGTLSPIVDDPDLAFMSHSMRATVRKVAKYFPTAIVSGRCRNKVYGFVRLSELYYAGSHGMDIIGPSKATKYSNKGANEPVPFQPAKEFLPVIDEVQKVLVEKIKSIPGAKVENNKFCISVHFRCVDEKKWGELARQVKSVMEDYPKFRLSTGRKVLEIRPIISWDKGKALEFLLESLGYANSTNVFPVYIGDDQTDEDAFKVLQKIGQGFGILVSKTPKETNASYSLQEPSEVMDFLQRLVEWKKSIKRQFRVRRRLQVMLIEQVLIEREQLSTL